MRTSFTLPACIAARRPAAGVQARGGAQCAVIVCALLLAGCAQAYSDYTESISDDRPASSRRHAAKKTIPLPNQALLTPPSKPDCEAAGQQLASTGAPTAIAPPQANTDLALRIKLEYERECYRQAEARVREQLRKLQVSASETAKAVKHLEHDPR
jgi:hypothetical protein